MDAGGDASKGHRRAAEASQRNIEAAKAPRSSARELREREREIKIKREREIGKGKK